ncbi:helix-turn-helix domain-containing protein [Kordiimonas sp. SCSIO 12603]|uniref:helix-turn-helix domain-containing protein n=1 Tax=Kordiimonas sp. SCSIO 12603 TaxID=2829596 RepID=UPI0021068061|nr:helix-turn-helix transcriptional regulator [Kordiimonas sp. SCSIO 12603]
MIHTSAEMDLKHRRLAKNWSQEQLAAISGVSSRTIQRIENGAKPGMETLKALAAGLEVSVTELQEEEIEIKKSTETEGSMLLGFIPFSWKAFVLNLVLFMVVETWVLVLTRYFEVGKEVPGAVAFLWGGVLAFHLVTAVRKDP